MTVLDCSVLVAVRGAFHVHTALDDGEGDRDHILAAAADAELDWVYITDHHRAWAAEKGWQGRHDGVLLAVGTELCCDGSREVVALGVHQKIGSRLLPVEKVMRLLDRLGATAIIPHPQGWKRYVGGRSLPPFDAWNATDWDAVEVWSYMHDWIRSFRPWRLPDMCRNPQRYIHGPEAEVLRRWDEQAQRRVVGGVGALDSHGRRLPFGLSRLFSWAAEGVLPYRQNFSAFSHHALVPRTWGEHVEADIRDLTEALASGRGWICREELGPGGGFVFALAVGPVEYPTGTEVLCREDAALRVRAPEPCRIVLKRRGETVAEVDGETLEFAVAEPGEYRVEAYRGDDLWILTNHIYLRGPNWQSVRRP